MLKLTDQILDEEFLDSEMIKINHLHIHKRIKLGLFILKQNKQTDDLPVDI